MCKVKHQLIVQFVLLGKWTDSGKSKVCLSSTFDSVLKLYVEEPPLLEEFYRATKGIDGIEQCKGVSRLKSGGVLFCLIPIGVPAFPNSKDESEHVVASIARVSYLSKSSLKVDFVVLTWVYIL